MATYKSIKYNIGTEITGEIATAAIADDAITAAKIADNAVVTAAINADAVTAAKIGDNVIDSEHYAADSIDAEHYAAGTVDTTALAADAVTAAKVADDVLNSEHYAAGSVDNEHVASDIDGSKIGAGTIAVARMGSGTANNTVHLRGDGAWAAAGGSTDHKAVGTYHMCFYGSSDVKNPGQTVAGSTLGYRNDNQQGLQMVGSGDQPGGNIADGTWRMASAHHIQMWGNMEPNGLWCRVS